MAGSAGKIIINNKPYNIAAVPDSYKVTEVPNHGDVDPKMERRVIWRNFTLGINRRREDASMDATSITNRAFSYMRQVRNPEGIYWATGGDTTRQDRVFAQRLTTDSNFNDGNEQVTHFVDGSLASILATKNKVYQLTTAPGTWTLSSTFGTYNELSDIIQYGGQIYVAISPFSGTSTSVAGITLTDSSQNWTTNRFTGATLTTKSSTATITSNTGTVLVFSGGWTGGTPAVSTYQLTKGIWTWNQLPSGSWIQQPNTVSAYKFTVIREQLWRCLNANIYATINIDPANQVWGGATVIGDPSTPITGLDSFKDFLMIFKSDGVYSADKNGGVYPLFPGFKNLGTNPRPLGQFEDRYYFASDVGLVWSYSPRGGVHRIGFDYAEPYPMDAANVTTKFSIPNAVVPQITSLTHYTIVGFNQYVATSTSSAYFLGWDGKGWHPIQYYNTATAQASGMTGGNLNPAVPILHFAITQGGRTHIYYMQKPLLDPFIAASFDTSVQTIYLPVDNGALEDEYKVLERVNIIIDNPEAGYVRMFYALDEEIASLTFHDMGEPSFRNTAGNQIFRPPSPLPTYNRIMLKFTITAKASTACPAVRTIILHYKQRSPQRRTWDIALLADNSTIGANGRLDVRSSKTMLNDLNKARIQHLQIPFQDALKQQLDVYVDEVQESIKILRGSQNPSYIVTVKLVEAVDGR